MAERENQVVDLPEGEGGGGYSTPARVPRDEESVSPSGIEEVLTSSALGASTRVFQEVHPVLLEDGYQRARATRIFRRTVERLGVLYRRALLEMEGEDDDRVWELLEEAETIENTVYSIRRRLQFLGEDSG
jgi:hypothetical protein